MWIFLFQIFTKVCATLNADIFQHRGKDLILSQLSEEDNVQISIMDDPHCTVTVEAPLPTLARVHNRLKDILNVPSPTHLQVHAVKSSSGRCPKFVELQAATMIDEVRGRVLNILFELTSKRFYNKFFNAVMETRCSAVISLEKGSLFVCQFSKNKKIRFYDFFFYAKI